MFRVGCGILAALVVVIIVISAAASGGDDKDKAVKTPTSAPGFISRTSMGAAWPFTVESGVVKCSGKNGVGEVTFVASNGTTYAVNGLARSAGKYPDAFDIQAFDANRVAKGDLNAVIARGLALCK